MTTRIDGSAHKPMAFAKCIKPPSERTHGELSPEIMTWFCFD